MSAPNIVNLSSIFGNTDVNLLSTSAVAVTSNPVASGKVYKINTIFASNISGASVDVTCDLYRSATGRVIAPAITLAPKSMLVILGKDTPIYLLEGDSIRGFGSIDASVNLFVAYEIIS
jgi:hypothetical protein